MTDIEILDQMIKDEAREALQQHFGKKKVILTEPKETNLSVSVYSVPEDTIVIKADKFESPDSLFGNSKGECKRCDYIIVADDGSKKVILCIEMTKTSKPQNEVIQQLKGAQCLMGYCKNIGQLFWKQDNFLSDYEFRFVFISQMSINKRKTRCECEQSIHNSPEKMLKIRYPNQRLQFNQIAGRA